MLHYFNMSGKAQQYCVSRLFGVYSPLFRLPRRGRDTVRRRVKIDASLETGLSPSGEMREGAAFSIFQFFNFLILIMVSRRLRKSR